LPWTVAAANWCYDASESQRAGGIRFKLPYPQPGKSYWYEMKANHFILEAMTVTVEAIRVFSKPIEQWDGEDDNYYAEMCKELKAWPNVT